MVTTAATVLSLRTTCSLSLRAGQPRLPRSLNPVEGKVGQPFASAVFDGRVVSRLADGDARRVGSRRVTGRDVVASTTTCWNRHSCWRWWPSHRAPPVPLAELAVVSCRCPAGAGGRSRPRAAGVWRRRRHRWRPRRWTATNRLAWSVPLPATLSPLLALASGSRHVDVLVLVDIGVDRGATPEWAYSTKPSPHPPTTTTWPHLRWPSPSCPTSWCCSG